MTDHPKIEIPKFLNHLPVYAGFPIPFTTFVHEGKPDFRVTDMDHWDACVTEDLCGVCGKKLGEYCYFIGGSITLKYRLFFDPAMHKECSDFASKICPFLNGRRTEYRPMEGPQPKGFEVEVVEIMSDVRPGEMYIMKARTKKVDLVRYQNRLLIRAEKFLKVQKF